MSRNLSCFLRWDTRKMITAHDTATQSWTSPSGTRWLFVYGRSQTPSATEVGVVWTVGRVVPKVGRVLDLTHVSNGSVLATARISNGWFILSVSATQYTTQQPGGLYLVYYGATGRRTGTYLRPPRLRPHESHSR